MKRYGWLLLSVTFILSCAVLAEESFIVKKSKPQQSFSKLKQQYADELAELIRMVPRMQKQLADIQERMINELCSLMENDLTITKVDLDARVHKSRELRSYLSQESKTLESKIAFIPRVTPPEIAQVPH